MAALPTMLEHDRKQAGLSVEQAARRLRVSVREYRELEAGERWSDWETFDRICKLYCWPQTFAGSSPPAPSQKHRRPRWMIDPSRTLTTFWGLRFLRL
jgi:transcriptional regulator with XRE-family HTH domain